MPSIYFHLAEAKIMADRLNTTRAVYPFMKTEKWEEYLSLGTVLTDSTPRAGKYITHFWNPKNYANVVIAPDIDLFKEKYPDYIYNPILTGYLLHLHLDFKYFTELLPQFVKFTDADGNPEHILEKVIYATLNDGTVMPRRQFFTPEYLYGEYLRQNPYFAEKYDLSFPMIDDETLADWPLSETNPDKYYAFREKSIGDLSSPECVKEMKVFSREIFENFVIEALDDFIDNCL